MVLIRRQLKCGTHPRTSITDRDTADRGPPKEMAKPDLSGDRLSPDAGCGICRVLNYTAAQRGDVTFVNRPSPGEASAASSEDEKQSREVYEITIIGCARRYVTIQAQALCPNIIYSYRAAYHRRPLSRDGAGALGPATRDAVNMLAWAASGTRVIRQA